jgi:hypothetical protein
MTDGDYLSQAALCFLLESSMGQGFGLVRGDKSLGWKSPTELFLLLGSFDFQAY